MDATRQREVALMDTNGTVERTSDRETVVTRTVNGPARLVFDAWTRAELLERWWTPKSFPITLLSCETDPRVGGTYKLTFGYEGSTFDFFGRYLEVTPPSRLVWTNDEGAEGAEGAEGGQVTTVTFEETDGKTRLVIHDRYPSKEALDAAIASGSTSGMAEALGQLDELLPKLA
jgi:uncharacterized protein YndB with AHSA1/START domain